MKVQFDKDVVIAIIATLVGMGVAFVLLGYDLSVTSHTNSEGRSFYVSMIGVAFLLLSGVVFAAFISRNVIIKHYRKDRFRYCRNLVKVGILSGSTRRNNQNTCQFHGGPPSPVITPQQWVDFFERGNYFEPRIIDSEEISNKYAFIVNPFGERYPEEDFATKQSFHMIKKYIEDGGIFVNTSGMAFYYMWDSFTGTQQITGLPLETYRLRANGILEPVELMGETSVSHSWMNENFDVRTTIGDPVGDPTRPTVYQSDIDRQRCGDIANLGGTDEIEEYRAAVYGSYLIPLLRCERTVLGHTMQCYPLAATKVGFGYLIITGFTPNSVGWFEKISSALTHLSIRIMEKGSIE